MIPEVDSSSWSKLWILVLNWNNPGATIRCLQSILELRPSVPNVVVVDNGSADDSAEQLASRFGWINLLRLTRNLGYAGGNNEGLRFALERGAEYMLILNNDVLLDPSSVLHLIDAMVDCGRIGIAGPKVLGSGETPELFATGSVIDWYRGDVEHLRIDDAGPAPQAINGPASNRSHPQSIDFLVGTCLLVTRRFTETVGLFDEDYFLNFEDVDWCVRARRADFQLRYVPESVVRHEISGTLGIGSPANTYYMTRNALRFFRIHGKTQLRWIAIGRIFWRTARTIAAWKIRHRYRNDLHRRKARANLLAVRDFLKGDFGEMGPDVRRICYPQGPG